MQKENIELSFFRAKVHELSAVDKDLIRSAKQYLLHAYAPYSGFLVGSSILLDNGEIINGSNQENVAYPSGLCAERVALFYAASQYPDIGIKTIAVSAFSKNFDIIDVVSPCGACRQVMAEYEDKQVEPIKVILHSPNDDVLIANKVQDLLPFAFKSPYLRRY
tara:strand:+ start:608 stop:1096 length:489 start_codon:yes stop_codon:yes gene_type:complete